MLTEQCSVKELYSCTVRIVFITRFGFTSKACHASVYLTGAGARWACYIEIAA